MQRNVGEHRGYDLSLVPDAATPADCPRAASGRPALHNQCGVGRRGPGLGPQLETRRLEPGQTELEGGWAPLAPELFVEPVPHLGGGVDSAVIQRRLERALLLRHALATEQRDAEYGADRFMGGELDLVGDNSEGVALCREARADMCVNVARRPTVDTERPAPASRRAVAAMTFRAPGVRELHHDATRAARNTLVSAAVAGAPSTTLGGAVRDPGMPGDTCVPPSQRALAFDGEVCARPARFAGDPAPIARGASRLGCAAFLNPRARALETPCAQQRFTIHARRTGATGARAALVGTQPRFTEVERAPVLRHAPTPGGAAVSRVVSGGKRPTPGEARQRALADSVFAKTGQVVRK